MFKQTETPALNWAPRGWFESAKSLGRLVATPVLGRCWASSTPSVFNAINCANDDEGRTDRQLGCVCWLWSELENVCRRKIRPHFARYLLEEPSQGLAAFSLRATVDDVEREKEVPIADSNKKGGQPLLIEFAL